MAQWPYHKLSNTYKQNRVQSVLFLCSVKWSTITQTHTLKHTHCQSGYQRSTPCVSATPGFCFLHGLRWQWGFPFSVTHVERWYVWILNRMPQRIPNCEHGVVAVVVGEFIFTFILPWVHLGCTLTKAYSWAVKWETPHFSAFGDASQ